MSSVSATDVSARVVNQARDALLQGRIADAMDAGRRRAPRRRPRRLRPGHARPDRTAGQARPRRPPRRRTVLPRADLLVRIRGPVAAIAPASVSASSPPRAASRPGRVLLRARRRGARRRRRPHLAAVAQRAGPDLAGRGEIAPATAWSRRSSPRRAPSTRRTPSPTRCARWPRSRRPTDRVELLDEALERARGHGSSAARGADPYRPRRLAAAAAAAGVGPRRRPPARVPRSTRGRRSSPHCSDASGGCSSVSARHRTASSPAGWPS